MPRLIDADRLLSEPMKNKYYHLKNGDTAVPLIDIKNAPTVDAVPVRRGKWILQGDSRKALYGWYFCSECGAFIGGKTNFCSECGADMRKDSDGNG